VNANNFRNVWHESSRVADTKVRALQNETDVLCQFINRRDVIFSQRMFPIKPLEGLIANCVQHQNFFLVPFCLDNLIVSKEAIRQIDRQKILGFIELLTRILETFSKRQLDSKMATIAEMFSRR
jgi:hypothetical protein